MYYFKSISLDINGLERQAIPVFSPSTFPPSLPIFPATAAATTAALPAPLTLSTNSNGQTCVCVPTGSCPVTATPQGNTDGSGILDIRIVTNVSTVFFIYILQIKL